DEDMAPDQRVPQVARLQHLVQRLAHSEEVTLAGDLLVRQLGRAVDEARAGLDLQRGKGRREVRVPYRQSCLQRQRIRLLLGGGDVLGQLGRTGPGDDERHGQGRQLQRDGSAGQSTSVHHGRRSEGESGCTLAEGGDGRGQGLIVIRVGVIVQRAETARQTNSRTFSSVWPVKTPTTVSCARRSSRTSTGTP